MDESIEEGKVVDGTPDPETVFKKCLDAPGYVYFVGILRHEPGGVMLDMRYSRYNLNLEDLKNFFKNVREETIKDLVSGIDPL